MRKLWALPIALPAALFAGCDALVGDPPPQIIVTPPDDPDDPNDPNDVDCDPGNKRVHRLNRVEYDNTVRDLLLVDARPGQEFPSDDIGYGFDNNADVLSTSPLLVEKLDAAAELLAQLALLSASANLRQTFEAEVLTGSVGVEAGEEWNLFSNGNITANITLDADGTYAFRARAREQAAGPDPAHMVFRVDGNIVAEFDVNSTAAVYEVSLATTAGGHTFSVAFTNDFYQPANGLDRNLLVDYLEVEGPEGATGEASPSRDRIMVCTDATESCARQIFSGFLGRAYRRPATAEELDGIITVVNAALGEGETFDEAVQLGVHAALLSPSFLYRAEYDADPNSTEPHAVAPYELASRLSYFIWSSMPDDALLAKASDGSISTPEVMLAEVDRMLSDPRSAALVSALAGQWLQTRALDDAYPDPERFPEVNDEMKASMKRETALLLETFLRDDTRRIEDIIDADFTFVDPTLAAFYGVAYDAAAADAEGFAPVSLAGTDRVGVLTHGGFLMFTSYPLRTSPVKRGKWVLEQVLCIPPPPPPPDVVGQISEDENAASLRERLEQHRSNPECAGCHAMMDPIGFGLEHFSPIGKYRDDDNGFVIEDNDVFFTGEAFEGPHELAAIIKAQPDVQRCVAEKMATFATGRGFSGFVNEDICTIDDVAARTVAEGGSLGDVIRAIVTSDAFLKRRGEGGT